MDENAAHRPAPKEPETELTPEMIAAGVRELVRFNPEFDRESDAVKWIYEAMEQARLQVRPLDRPFSAGVGDGGRGPQEA